MRNHILTILFFTSLNLLACSVSNVSAPTPTPDILQLSVIKASTDFSPGVNRLAFALLDSDAKPINATKVTIDLGFVEENDIKPKGRHEAIFRPWPAGPGGIYTAYINLPTPGIWTAELRPQDGEWINEKGQTFFEVKQESNTPSLNSRVPASQHPTLEDVKSLKELTSDPDPDPDLYTHTIAEAMTTELPMVVVFATPAFCSSSVCGPQVDVIKELKRAYNGQVTFIHIDIFTNYIEMEGDISKGRLSPVVKEWGLPTEPWTFIVNPQGILLAKFESFASYEELDDVLKETLV